jgi:predicted Zn-dependent protease
MNKRLQMLDAMIEKGTDDPFVRYARALELRGEDDHERALQALAEVRTLHPDYVPTYLMAGQLAVELERIDEARQWLEQGLHAAEAARDEHARSELQQALDALQ